nr:lipopolysaccharide biosynthesis protein [Kineococcus siccus]
MLNGASWSAVQKWASRLAGTASFVVLSRLLDPSDFGLVALAASVVAVLQMVTEGGFSAYLVQAVHLGQKTISTAFWTSLVVSVVSAGLVVAGAPLIAALFHEPDLAAVLMVLAAGVLVTGFTSVQGALLSREMKFRTLAQQQLVASLTSTVVALVLAFAGAGVWALVAQSLTLGVLTSVLLWRASDWRPSRGWDRAEARTMLSFSWKVLGANFLNQFRDRGEQFIIAAVGGAVLLGYWTIATRILQIIMELTVTVLQGVTLPVFARLKTDPERLRRGYRKVLTATAAIVAPIVVVASQTSGTLVPLVFGSQWQPTAAVAGIITLSGFAWAMNSFDRSLYQAFGRPGVDLVLSAVLAVVQVAAVLVFAQYGLVALAVASLVRTYAVWPVRLAVLKRVCGLPWVSYAGIPAVVVAAALSGGTMYAVEAWWLRETGWLQSGVQVAVGVPVYAGAVLALSGEVRAFVREGRSAIGGRLRRSRPPVTTTLPQPDSERVR